MKKTTKETLQTVKKIEYIIEEKDIGTIKKCLDYCAHRLKKHPKCGIKELVDEKELRRIREYFNKDESEEDKELIEKRIKFILEEYDDCLNMLSKI